jgi:hypothetical protein
LTKPSRICFGIRFLEGKEPISSRKDPFLARKWFWAMVDILHFAGKCGGFAAGSLWDDGLVSIGVWRVNRIINLPSGELSELSRTYIQ